MSTPPVPSDRLGRLLAAIELDAGNLSLRKDAIREACNTGQWRTALELVEVGLHGHPGDSGLLAMAGMAHLLARQYVDAERVLSAAVARGMEAPEVRYNLAFALFMQGRMSDALEVLAAPAVAEAVPAALLLRARCLHHFGRLKEAIADCRDLLALLPGSADTHGFLALLLYDEGQSDAARRHAEMAMRYDPNQLEALLVRAYRYSDVREYDDARACFRTLLEAHPDCGRAWLGLALIDLAEMQLPAAKGNIELAARYLPKHVGTWHVFAWLQLIDQDVAAAEAAFQQALTLDRNFAETHGGLAVVAVLQRRDDEARASIKRALRVDSQSVSAQYAQILLLQREGHQQEADSALGTVLARPMDREGNQLRELVSAHLATVRPFPRATAV